MKNLLGTAGFCLLLSIFLQGAATKAERESDLKVEALLSRNGPRLMVQVVHQLDSKNNWSYDLHVTTTDGLDQHFPVRNGQAITEKGIRLIDVTSDGYLDILIVGGKDHRGEDWFKTWLFDAKVKKYKWINDR